MLPKERLSIHNKIPIVLRRLTTRDLYWTHYIIKYKRVFHDWTYLSYKVEDRESFHHSIFENGPK